MTVFICSVLTATVELAEPYIAAEFIDKLLLNKDTETFYTFILILLLISIVAVVTNWITVIFSSKMRININNQIIEDVMRHIYTVRGEALLKTDMVYLSKRLDQDANDLVYFVINNMVDICINFILLGMAFFLLCSIDFKWGSIFLVITAIYAIVYKILQKTLFECSIVTRETESRYFVALSDMLLYVYSIKLHGIYEKYIKIFQTAFKKNFQAVIRQVKIQFWFTTSSLNANAIFKVLERVGKV